MDKQKVILYIQPGKSYEGFLSILSKKYKDICMVANLTALRLELDESGAGCTLVFIDHACLGGITPELASVLKQNNYLCVVLTDSIDNELNMPSFVYDLLPCNKVFPINRFFTRLEKELNYRLQLEHLEYQLESLYDIGKRLSSEKDIKVLLDLIINSCMKLSMADAATIYIVIDSATMEWSTYERNAKDRLLKFVIARNNSIEIDIESSVAPISAGSIVGYTAISGYPLRIEDAYKLPEDAEYSFNAAFDKKLGYKTGSILSVPMKDHQNRVLGVIQLINKKVRGEIVPFTRQDERLIFSLAGQAAITLENNLLYKSMEDLLEQYRQVLNEEVHRRKQGDEEIFKLLAAVEHSPSAVTIMDAGGNIQYVNQKFQQLTGYSLKEAVGKTPGFLKSGYHSQDFYKKFWDTILSGQEWYGEFYNKKKNGEFYWESTSVSSLKDESGAIKYFIAVREDITEKKQIARHIEEKNRELQVALENLSKAQNQLIQKEKMASIGQLAAGMAHEINNPLGFIMSNFDTLQGYAMKIKTLVSLYDNLEDSCASMAKDKLQSGFAGIREYRVRNKLDWALDDLQDLLKDSMEGLDRVKNIVSALRMFAGIDQYDEISEYDLNEGVKSTLEVVGNMIRSCAEIQDDCRPVPTIMAAGAEINQVILSLLLNAEYAVKVNQQNRAGIIYLKTYHDENNVFFEIADNGIGIEPGQIHRIFEPFYTTRPVGEATGLGLSIAYETIVQKYNGDISVDSEPGIGTRFTVRLPIRQSSRY